MDPNTRNSPHPNPTQATTSTPRVVASAPAQTSGDIVITERFLGNPAWPSDLILELNKANWPEWSRRIRLLADRTGFTRWLEGTLECPDENAKPEAFGAWGLNDWSLRDFLLKHVSIVDSILVDKHETSHQVFEALRKRHELYAQFFLIEKALHVRFDLNTPISTTISEIRQLYSHICDMGSIDPDKMFTVFLTNALGDQFGHLQPSFLSMADDSKFSSDILIERLESEGVLMQRRMAQEMPANTHPLSPFPAVKYKQKFICSNCKRPNHTVDFCIRRGGKMAGRSLEEARTAQRAASGNHHANY